MMPRLHMLLLAMVVMATLIDDSEGWRRRRRRRRRSMVNSNDGKSKESESLLGHLDYPSQESGKVIDEWKQVATHENGLPYNPLGSPMFVAPRPTDQQAINLMCSFIQEKPWLPNVEHDDEDVTTPNWDRLYADRSEDVAECCQMEGDEQELCIEKLRQKNADQYCYFWAHSMEYALGLHEPCCEEAGEARVQCMDQARYGFDNDIHDTDRTIEMMHVPLMQTLKRLSKQGISRPAPFDHKFCTWAKQQPHLATPFDEVTVQRMDPIQKNSEVTRTLTSCCYISDHEPTIDQCMSSVREKVLDELCWEQKVVETALPLLDASVVSEVPAGLKAIMSYKDDIPAHPCCQKSHTNRYSCFSQEWFGFEAHGDTYDHTAEIAQYKEKFAQLKSKIFATKVVKADCGSWFGGEVLPDSGKEIEEEIPEEIEYPSDEASHQEIIDYINSINTTWKAGWNDFGGASMSDLKVLCGTILDDPDLLNLPVKQHDLTDMAIASTEVLSDRLCIETEGSTNRILSSEDLLSCDKAGRGCSDGGRLSEAWRYMQKKGVVANRCKPYTSGATGFIPECMSKCTGEGHAYQKFYAGKVYTVSGENQIMAEIMTKGPVSASFTVYKDFEHYRSGVYKHVSGSAVGGHAVKIVGWGEENGTKYWIVANSWGTYWGEDGYFKIMRGSDECGIESMVLAGTPSLDTA